MEKKNENDVLTAILRIDLDDENCLSNRGYGWWEALSVDMLSPNETRRLAEHLDVCEKCREECADIYEMACDDVTPFIARMRAFRENPAAETDLNWRKIAVAFDPSLAPALDVTVAQETSVEPQISATQISENAPRPCDPTSLASRAPSENVRATTSKVNFGGGRSRQWLALCSSALVLCFAVFVFRTEKDPEIDVALNDPPTNTNENATANNTEDTTFMSAHGISGGGAPKGGLSNDGPSWCRPENVAPAVEKYGWKEIEEASKAFREASEALLEERNEEAARMYAESARMYAEVIERLEAEKNVDEETLFVVYWNGAVAFAAAGNYEEAVKLLKDARPKVGGEEGKMIDEAVDAWQAEE